MTSDVIVSTPDTTSNEDLPRFQNVLDVAYYIQDLAKRNSQLTPAHLYQLCKAHEKWPCPEEQCKNDPKNYKNDRFQLKDIPKIEGIIKQLRQMSNEENDPTQKNGLIKTLEKLLKDLKKKYLMYGFTMFIFLASFKTAETIITRLADTPTRKLTRRLKYAWTGLKFKSDGTINHNFVHNVGNVPEEYITKLKNEAPKFQKNMLESPYFESINLDTEAINPDVCPSELIKDDDFLSDIYYPNIRDDSPCSVHDGNKLKTDCVVCKQCVEDCDKPIVISAQLIKKINVSENLLKFLAIQQDRNRSNDNNATNRG